MKTKSKLLGTNLLSKMLPLNRFKLGNFLERILQASEDISMAEMLESLNSELKKSIFLPTLAPHSSIDFGESTFFKIFRQPSLRVAIK